MLIKNKVLSILVATSVLATSVLATSVLEVSAPIEITDLSVMRKVQELMTCWRGRMLHF